MSVSESVNRRFTPETNALLALVYRYLSAQIDPFITSRQLHRLAYFLQASGSELRLEVSKGENGPEVSDIQHVLVGSASYATDSKGQIQPDEPIEFHWDTLPTIEELIEGSGMIAPNVERVRRLISGYDSSFALDLLATVHWVMTKEGKNTVAGISQKIFEWYDDQKQITDQHIRIAMQSLKSEGWVS